MRRILIGLMLAMLGGPAFAQATVMTGAVNSPSGQRLTLNPFALYNQACNGGAGGMVGQTYTATLCEAPAATLPTGGATAANQALQLTQESAINGKLPSTLGQKTGANSLSTVPSSDATMGTATVPAVCSTLTLPGTGGTYSIGDLAANSATAGSVVPFTCTVVRYANGPFTITRARILTSNTTITAGSFRIHPYTGTPTVTNGNDGAWLSTESGHFCPIDVTLTSVFSDGADGFGVPNVGSTCTRTLTGGATTISGLLEARGAYAWTAAQTFIITLDVLN